MQESLGRLYAFSIVYLVFTMIGGNSYKIAIAVSFAFFVWAIKFAVCAIGIVRYKSVIKKSEKRKQEMIIFLPPCKPEFEPKGFLDFLVETDQKNGQILCSYSYPLARWCDLFDLNKMHSCVIVLVALFLLTECGMIFSCVVRKPLVILVFAWLVSEIVIALVTINKNIKMTLQLYSVASDFQFSVDGRVFKDAKSALEQSTLFVYCDYEKRIIYLK